MGEQTDIDPIVFKTLDAAEIQSATPLSNRPLKTFAYRNFHVIIATYYAQQ